MLSGRQQVGWHVDGVATGLYGLDRRAGGDAAHDRHGNRPAATVVVLGACHLRPHAAKVALDDAGVKAPRPPAAAADAMGDRVGQLDDLDGARPVGQAADEAALLQRRDQPVDAGFRPQVERVLHLVEGRRNPGLGQPFMNETQELELLAGQHIVRFSPSRPAPQGFRGCGQKQIMNGHYPFHMCSATI